ncbi:MAG: 4-alpha-glucanotransferase [Thermodesulfobacteriota bacterium]|jgi:4-alpha-glucanotransferase|nr:4-alpha-glucanotransferase [Thermodesulfobacteriota bacterium]
MKITRCNGILLHPTSLPGPHGIGSLGEEAFQFVDFLAETGQGVWQVLPLNPTGYGDSPYNAFSAFAGNPLLIDLRELVSLGDLDQSDIAGLPVSTDPHRVDYGWVTHYKEELLLRKAAANFKANATAQRRREFEAFREHQGYWLWDYARFRALRDHFDGASWNRWPSELRHRDPQALAKWDEQLTDEIFWRLYAQHIFFSQWFALKEYANNKGIRIFGDLPIFVAYDSVDVWANQHLFHLDEEGEPTLVAGVPPDYFSDDGQRWGNPLYHWDRMAAQGYSWWIARFRWNLAQADIVRIDHFRGFEACWAIPAEEKTAVNGEWMEGPGGGLFEALASTLGEVPIVAEDLGLITPEVEELRDRFAFPGMKVLHFAFDGGPDNPYLPHNIERNSVVYTGTHDNDTTLGWWNSRSKKEKDAVRAYLGHGLHHMPWDLIRTAMSSVANLCIIPMQDILELDSDGRMNRPGQGSGNWDWRFSRGQLTQTRTGTLKKMTTLYGRITENDATDS